MLFLNERTFFKAVKKISQEKEVDMPHTERCKKCKQRVKRLLEKAFNSQVLENYYDDDLDLPTRLSDLSQLANPTLLESLCLIFNDLVNYRGFSDFVKRKKLSPVDFYVKNENIIVEFDESQHFTMPRALTFRNYPIKGFGFSIHFWRQQCKHLKRKDNHPYYRDEQRAWYDTLRDFAPLLLGKGKTIRLYASAERWCDLNPQDNSDLNRFKKYL